MKTIKIKNRFNGEVIYSHECAVNTIKTTVSQAIEQNANLRGSDLSGTNLSFLDLSGSDLRGSDLSGTNLRFSDLSGTNLSGSDLRGSDLSGSDLSGVIGNCREIKTIQTNIWSIVMTEKVMAIGCKQHEIKKWEKFTDEEIADMDSRALEFWNGWKKIIFKIHKLGFKK